MWLIFSPHRHIVIIENIFGDPMRRSKPKMERGTQVRYMVVIEEGDTSFGAYVPDLPGCVAIGETEAEVRQLIQEAIEFHLEDLQESGTELPKPISRSEYVEVLMQ
jgi:predicted RNase H-like HicB family nuclease